LANHEVLPDMSWSKYFRLLLFQKEVAAKEGPGETIPWFFISASFLAIVHTWGEEGTYTISITYA